MERSSGGTPELEGTTLGHNSRDGRQPDPKTRARNRMSGGGGFLLDSIYRRNSPYGSISTQRPQQHVPTHSGGDKRQRADDEIAVSKRRVVSNSDRDTEHEEKKKGISPRTSSLTAVSNTATSEGHESSQNESFNSRHASSRNSHSSKPGLDTHTLQIVNLALNLSESKKKAATSMRIPSSPLPGIPRLSTNNQRHFSHADNVSRGLAGNNKALRASSFQAQGNKNLRNVDSPTPTSIFDGGKIANHGVAGILPSADILDVDFVCSQATLGRIEKAKQHFELFSKYLELLSYLPPLQHPFIGARYAGGRKYNPLQSIRNRKLRLRDKNNNQTDTQGWQNIGRVEEWVASVAAAHQPESAKDPFLCASLPPFYGSREELLLENQSPLQTTTSPGSSIRGLNRNGTSKVQRPRLEWVISPAELFADAVWVESGSNKSKIYDGEGRKLYPDASKLRRDRSSSSVERAKSSQGNKLQSQEQARLLPGFTERTSQQQASHGPALFNEYNVQTQITTAGGYAPKWTRSSSISDESDSDDMRSRGRARRLGQKAKMKAEAALQAEKLHRVLHGRSESSTNAAFRRSKSKSQPSSVKAGGGHGGSHGGGTQNLISPTGSVSGKGERGMSISEMDSTAPNSPSQGLIFPSITVNFSPPSSRSPSPQKRFPRIMETLQEKTKSHRHFRSEHGEEGGGGASFDESPSSSSQLRKRSPFDSGSSPLALAPSALPETALGQDEISLEDFRRNDNTPGSFKSYSTPESRLKGFLKNSRIAEIVGNEVSKVGDRIRRKEGPSHSRHSSYASSIVSDPRDSDEERSEDGGDATPSKRNALRRGSTFSDDETGLPWRKSNNGRTSAKPFFLNLPSRGSSLRSGNLHNHYQGQQLNDQDRLQQPESSRASDIHFISAHPDSVQPSSVDATPYSDRRRDSYGFESSPAQNSRKPSIKAITPQAALPDVERTRPPIPVTGLASMMASTKPQRRRSLAGTGDTSTINRDSHGWSLSDRSVPTIKDTNLMHKREILRCQALLLSSGVKASEIVYRYNQPRRRDRCSLPPRFLIKSLVDANAPVPANLSRIDEYDYAARNLLGRLDTIRTNLDKSIYLFSKSTLLPLQKEIDSLEDMIVNQLTPRVRSAAMDAETLNTELNTTSTLEIKQLSDTLDQGLRKRNRRLRSIRRIGFSLLEWTLVGVMWWLWLIVMMFKMLRSIAKGIVGGVRWILWL